MALRTFLQAACLLLSTALPAVGINPSIPIKPVQQHADAKSLARHLRAMGYKTRGGVDQAASDRDREGSRSFPHFASSFTVGGTTYPFAMVGNTPASGRTAQIKSVIVPLRMNFAYFGVNQDISHSFEPAPAVTNTVGSPIYVPAAFPNGFGQFGDQMQRAAFWNRMDRDHNWHVRMAAPNVAKTVDIYVTPETGTLYQDASGNFFGDVLIDFMDSQIQTILQFMNLEADTLPIFITDGVTAEALGYHTAYDLGGGALQTYVYTSWLDPALVDPLFADVSTFNHELAEWLNDPFVNNLVPTWAFPPQSDPAAACSGSPLLEVGDPQGNGPTYADFPTALVTLHGVTYHLQQVVLWQWFADEKPSSAFGGWYTFPMPSSLKDPAVYCQ
jgi:hypothetical protein